MREFCYCRFYAKTQNRSFKLWKHTTFSSNDSLLRYLQLRIFNIYIDVNIYIDRKCQIDENVLNSNLKLIHNKKCSLLRNS